MTEGASQQFNVREPASWGPAYGDWINKQPAAAQVLATTALGALQVSLRLNQFKSCSAPSPIFSVIKWVRPCIHVQGGVIGRVMGQFTSMNPQQMSSIQGSNPGEKACIAVLTAALLGHVKRLVSSILGTNDRSEPKPAL